MPNVLPPPVNLLERRLGLEEGSLDGVDKARAEDALGDASTLALDEVRSATATAWATSAPAVVVTVVLKAARREFENPQGYRSEALGERQASVEVASGVYFTDTELAIIRRAAGSASRGLGFTGSIRTPSGYESDLGLVIVPVAGQSPVNLLDPEDLIL